MGTSVKEKPRILIVDDTPVNIDVLGSILSEEYNIQVALNGETALNIVSSESQPDLVLLDVMMPGMDGYEVATIMKKDPLTAEIPIIFVTAKIEDEDEARGFDVGAVDYIHKPVKKKVVIQRVRTHLELKFHRERIISDLLGKDRQLTDLASQLDTETKIKMQNMAYFKELFKSSPYGIMLVDMNKNIMNVNDAFTNILGYSRQEMLGQQFPMVFASLYHECKNFMDRVLEGENVNFETICQHKEGFQVPVNSLAYPVRYDGDVQGVFIFYENISQRKIFEKRLEHQAFHDVLTGVPNRTFFEQRVLMALKRQTKDPDFQFAVMLIALDRFKSVNDTLGHQAGDILLKMVCERLHDCLRESDLLARLGGDEFVILLSGFHDKYQVARIASRLQKSVECPFHILGTEVNISSSIGIVMDTKNYQVPNELFRDADLAMYHAKDAGRGQFKIFTSQMHETLMETMTIEQELRRAVKKTQFILHYQPILRLDPLKVEGFEVLVRWEHPVRGLVPPSEFVPIAEEAGLILPMGRWIFQTACRTLAKWRDSFGLSVTLNINISVKEFIQPDFVEEILSIVKEYNLKPENIKLEFTESILIENHEWVVEKLNHLKSNGFILSLDDFGTGYSSLAYLSQFPFDQVKIDRSFIWQMEVQEQSREIVLSILSLCRRLGITCLAEGVETESQLGFLKENLCDCVQGFYYSKPMPEENVLTFLSEKGFI